jgi:hypothetical protein
MPTADSTESEIAALRDALLAAHQEHVGNLPLTALRAAARLHRFRLAWVGWVLGPWVVRGIPDTTRPSAAEQRLVGLYTQASGSDPDVARAEVQRIYDQLWLIDQRSPNWMFPDFADRRPASRAEVADAADAMLRYFLRGRQTDDPLFAETQTAYTAYQQAVRQSGPVAVEQRRRRAIRQAHRQEQVGALRRFVHT